MKKIEINLQLRPSKDLLNNIVISLLDYLLYSRSQIPFHFELFKKFIESKILSVGENAKKNDWKTEKQMKLATETLERISSLKEMIESEFISGRPTDFMFIFGNTIHTPKESYQIKIPSVSKSIAPTFINETAEVRKILLRAIQHEDLMSTDKDQLPPTNVFILFKRFSPIDSHPDLIELRDFRLTKSCKKFAIHFKDSSDFEIFDETFQGLSLNENTETVEQDEVFWYQSKTYIKGFKDVLVNNQSIWN